MEKNTEMKAKKHKRKRKKYQIIYADPPWKYSSNICTSRRIRGKYVEYPLTYPTLNTDNIMEMPVENISANDCILFLWTTDTHLPDALQVIEAWGFKYRTIGFVWIKQEKSGKDVCLFGHYTNKSSEICLLATRGKIHSYIKSRKVRQLVRAVRHKKIHSKKPNKIRKRIVELMGDLPRIELFARKKVEGWDVWGNEVKSDIKLLGNF